MRTVDDLAVWLHAQLDEDERVARAATRGPWRVANVADYGSATVDGPDAMQDGGADGKGGRLQVLRPLTVIPQDVDYGPTVELVDAEHIARHDPARVLAEVDAKRRILDEELVPALRDYDTERPDLAKDVRYDIAARVLQLLALPYADRPGYREEWRP